MEMRQVRPRCALWIVYCRAWSWTLQAAIDNRSHRTWCKQTAPTRLFFTTEADPKYSRFQSGPSSCCQPPNNSLGAWWNALLLHVGANGSSKWEWPFGSGIISSSSSIEPYKTPAPGIYRPERVHPQREPRAPSYSMSNRTRFRKGEPCPAPNTYTLPPLVGGQSQLTTVSHTTTPRNITKLCP